MGKRSNRRLINDKLDVIEKSSDLIKQKLEEIQDIVRGDYPKVSSLLKAGYESIKVFDKYLLKQLRLIF